MRSIIWKTAVTFLTLCVGSILVVILVTFGSKSNVTVRAQTPKPINEVMALEFKIPESKSNKNLYVEPNTSKNASPIRHINHGGRFCEKYLLKNIAKEESVDSQLIKLKNFNPDAEILSPKVKKWLEYMHKDRLMASELRNNRQNVLLLSSTSNRATGLATSLEYWYLEINKFHSVEFSSFSKNPKLIFWDKEGLLNYYSVIYSDDFLATSSERDYNDLTVNIERYKIDLDGKAQLISQELNLQCE